MPAAVSHWPRVTWLLPILNGMPFLVPLLESIAAQTYPNHEIIAWDNGSTDGSVEVLHKWIPAHIAGRVITGHPLPLGLARAQLAMLAQSELCAAIDADDVHLPARLARQVAQVVADPTLVAVGCIPEIIDANGNRLPDWEYPLDDAEIRWRTRWQSCLNAPSVLAKRTAVLAAGNYRDFKPGQDLDLWIRMTRIGPMKNLPERLVRYRRHEASVTGIITDYFAAERNIALANAETIFAGFDAATAIDLWEAAYPHHERHAVRAHHFRRLRDAARNTAVAVGLPEDSFLNTRYYRRQQRRMLSNFIYPYMPTLVRSAIGKARGHPV